ncbi:putative amidotransferase [Sporobolomyces salmoneus]|uniref:putative amidotransferase n=1 Tax=Sporobolomyces salmoneus TaxID=183962 RepID=UPI00316E3B05
MSTTSKTPLTAKLDLPLTAKRDALLVILLNDCPLPPVREQFGSYHDIFVSLFEHSLSASTPIHSSAGSKLGSTKHTLTIESYDVVQGVYPSEETIKKANGVLLTGSAASAYESDPWILDLVSYLQNLSSLNSSLKLIGICFGHQIIARAYGAKTEKNEKGWEVGTRNLELTHTAKQLFTRVKISVHQMHQDHVPTLPEGFESLGSTEICPIHGMVKFVDPEGPKTLENVSIITLQGHPEFNAMIVNEVIEVRERKGVFSKEFAEASREDANQHDDGTLLGWKLLEVLGI